MNARTDNETVGLFIPFKFREYQNAYGLIQRCLEIFWVVIDQRQNTKRILDYKEIFVFYWVDFRNDENTLTVH